LIGWVEFLPGALNSVTKMVLLALCKFHMRSILRYW
jgi:hypothetical protein